MLPHKEQGLQYGFFSWIHGFAERAGKNYGQKNFCVLTWKGMQ